MGYRAGSGAAPDARRRRRPAPLGQPLRLAARDRRGRVPGAPAVAVRPRALAARGARGDRRGGDRRLPDARPRRPDRRRRRRAGDGAPARAARAARLLPADRPEHHPVPRVVGLRADRDRDRSERALRARLRLRRRPLLEGALRCGRNRARPARPDRLRAPLRPPVRGLGGDRVAALPQLVVAPRPARRPAVAPARLGRVLAGVRPRAREHRLVDAARRRLHALLAQPLDRLLERRRRLLPADDPPVRARRRDRDVAADQRRAGAPDRDRRGRRRQRARPARAHGRRERRGVRQRLLGRGLDPEPAAGRAAAAPRRDRRRPSPPPGRC